MLVKRTHVSMYPSINRLRAIARYWSEIATFSYPLHLTPPLGVFPLDFREKFDPQKTRIMRLPGREDSLTIGLSRFDTIPSCDGQTESLYLRRVSAWLHVKTNKVE